MTKQSISRYSSLMSRIALVLMLQCLLMYFCGRVFNFTRALFIAADGYNITADIIFLVLDCIVSCIIYLVPVKVFDYFQRNSFREKNMPVKKEIISNDMIPIVTTLGICTGTVAYVINDFAVNAVADYTGFGDDYLFLSGFKYGYQIVIYFIIIAVIPAICEELLFRKVLCDALEPYGPKTAIIVTSVLFSLMHTSFSRVLHTLVIGFFCAWIYVGTKNIKIPILIHFTHNALSVINTVLQYKVSVDVASVFFTLRFFAFAVISVVCFVKLKNIRKEQLLERASQQNEVYDSYHENKQKYANHIEMLPDENGNEVLSLSKQEKIRGFFSPMMIVFIVLVLIQMIYWMSFLLV